MTNIAAFLLFILDLLIWYSTPMKLVKTEEWWCVWTFCDSMYMSYLLSFAVRFPTPDITSRSPCSNSGIRNVADGCLLAPHHHSSVLTWDGPLSQISSTGRCERSAGIRVPDRNEKKNNLPLSLGVRIRQPTTITEVKLTRCRDLRCSPSHFPHCHTRPDFRESRPKSVADGCLLPGLLRRQKHTHRQADVRGPLASGSLIELWIR